MRKHGDQFRLRLFVVSTFGVLALVSSIIASASQADDGANAREWPTHGGNPAHTGVCTDGATTRATHARTENALKSYNAYCRDRNFFPWNC